MIETLDMFIVCSCVINSSVIFIPCLKFSLGIYFPKNFIKINHIDVGKEFAYISVTYPDATLIKSINTIGVDRNTTHHILVASCLETCKLLKLGSSCNHIHQKYTHMRQNLQLAGKYAKVKAIKQRESNIVKDINHKTTTTLIQFAKENDVLIVLEDLKYIRQTAKQRKKQR